MLRLVRPGHRLPREGVASLSLETLKVTLDRALSKLVWLRMSLLISGG